MQGQSSTFVFRKPMAKVFLTCLASLKPFHSDELAVGLFSSLSIDLQRLHKSLEDKPPSLGWCSEAVSVIKMIHSRFLHYLEMSKVPSSWEGVEMLDEYMRASLDLLDLCNLLKLAVSGLDRYRMTVDASVNRLEDSGFSIEASNIGLERLERGRAKKLDETNFNKKEVWSKVKTTSMTNNNMRVLQTIRSAMSVMSFLIVSLILHPTPIEMNEGLFNTKLPGLDSFLDSIQKLLNSFGQKVRIERDEGEVVLHESKMIEDEYVSLFECVTNVVCGVEKRVIIEKVERIRKWCGDLKEGLHLFECVTNELFEDVIKGRKRVIQFITLNKIKA